MKPSTRRLLTGIFVSLVATAVGTVSANAQSFAYVANNGDNTVSVINTATNAVVATVPVGVKPWGVAITPDGAFVYVSNLNDNTVSVISTSTNTVVATVPVGPSPAGVAITPNGTFAYVANSGVNTVSVINTATNTAVATVSVGPGPSGLTITPNGALTYVVNADNSISVINTGTNAVVATVSVPGCGFGNDGPGLSITPNGALVYVSEACGEVGVISTATNQIVSTFSTTGTTGPGPNLYFVGFTPNGAFAYAAVAGFSYVSVIDTSTNVVVAKVPAGHFDIGVAVRPDGAFAYVTNNSDNTVSVINTAGNTVVATVPVGSGPFGVAITPFLDNDSQFSQLNGGNTFTGNQTVNGNVNATNFVGNGAGLSAVNAATLGSVPASNYARLDIRNLFSGNQTVNGNVTASAFVGDGSGLTNITSSTANSANTANFANAATLASTANNSSSLGGITASNYARLDIGNALIGDQSVTGNITSTGSISTATGSINAISPQNGGHVMGTFIINGDINSDDVLFAKHTGFGNAIHAMNTQFGGTAGLFEANGAGRVTRGVAASVVSPLGIAGYFANTGGGEILSLQNASGEVSSVDGNGIFHFATGQTFPAGASGLGTITGVTAGSGLSGGGTTGNVGLSIPAAGVSNAMLANPAFSISAGAGLTGGGTFALGSGTTLSLTSAACGAGNALTALPLTCTPFPIFGANNFTGNQAMPNLTVTGTINSGFGNFSGGVTSSSPSGGVAVQGGSAGGIGVSGQSTNAIGVFATTASTSPTVAAGVFANSAAGNAGNILLGQSANVTKFSVNGKGDVAASGNMTAAGSVTIGTGGTPILEHLSQPYSVSVPGVPPNNCMSLTPVTLTGASDGYTIALGVPNALVAGTTGDFLQYFAWVSSPNTVTIRVCNPHGAFASNPASGMIRVDIWKH